MKNAKHLKTMEEYLILKAYSKSSRKIYMSAIATFFGHFPGKDSKRITIQDAVDFLMYQIQEKKISISYQKQFTAAINMFFEGCLRKRRERFRLPNPRRKNKLPNVLQPSEIEALLRTIQNPKQHLIIALMYSCGLRVSEACNLRIQDINSSEMSITIREPKWNKDRKVMLDEGILGAMKKYYEQFQPKDLFFEGRDGAYTPRSVQMILKTAAKNAGITKPISTHTLRHSCFTALLKQGASLMHIKELAGHKYLSTTEKYLHIGAEDVLKLKSPIQGVKLEINLLPK